MSAIHSRFKILYQAEKRLVDWPLDVPFDLILAVESRCKRNHSQSVQRLNERGGLSPLEMYAVLNDLSWHDVRGMTSQQAIDGIIEMLEVFEADRKQDI